MEGQDAGCLGKAVLVGWGRKDLLFADVWGECGGQKAPDLAMHRVRVGRQNMCPKKNFGWRLSFLICKMG